MTAALVGLAPGCARNAPVAPPAWVAAPRDLAGADHWLVAGEVASAHLSRTNPTVLFVGDSITEWWQRYGVATWERDFVPLGAVDDGVVGDTTSNLLYRLESGSLTGLHPTVVVMLIGTNNIPLRQPAADIIRGIQADVSAVRDRLPVARILVLGLLPRSQPGSRDRQVAAEVDALLPASLPPGVGYADPGLALLSPGTTFVSGRFVPGVIHPDLLHPTAAGYSRLGARILPAVKALLAAPR